MGWRHRDRKAAGVGELVGLTLSKAERIDDPNDGDTLVFETTNGRTFRMSHCQDCYESVDIEDICGDLDDLVGSPIVMAEESSNSDDPKKNEYDDSWTWTFYRFATAKGYVTVRWYGSSNGYYSESVDFEEVLPESS